MGSLLLFLCPRFSEEVAWLQEHHGEGESLDSQIKEGKTTLQEQGLTVANFQLHLSPDVTSQKIPSSLLDASQAGRIASNNVLLLQKSEASPDQGERENQFRTGYNAGVVNFPSLGSQQETPYHICPQSLAKHKVVKMNHEENVGYLNVSDVNEAVEFSIVASEALVIHDIVKSLSCTKSLAATAVLEVALRVKHARLEGLEDSFHCSTVDTEETDTLSDLDESNMADAFEDVGLSDSSNLYDLHAGSSAIFQVRDTPVSDNHNGIDDKYKCERHGAPKIDCNDIPTRQGSTLNMANQEEKDFPVEVLDIDSRRKPTDNPNFGLNTFDVASHNDSALLHSSLENSDVQATTEGFHFAMENVTSFPPQGNSNSPPQAWSYVNEMYDKLAIAGPDRFESRWLGGWMWKEKKASAIMEHNNTKIVAKEILGETSYLSESADIAPDENSCVQKQEKGSHMASQSRIPSEGLHKRADEGILFSPDVIIYSSFSSVDPLCSVVPCSISSENICSNIPDNRNDEVDAGKCSRPASENSNVNLQIISTLNSESVHEEQEAFTLVNGEIYQPTVRRQLTSLRAYSMLLPYCSTFVESNSIYQNNLFPSVYSSELLSVKQNTACKRVSTGLPSSGAIHKYGTASEIEENRQTLAVQNVVTDMMNQKGKCDETGRDGTRLEVHKEKDRCLPLIVNRGRHSRFQSSKETVHCFSGEKNPQELVMQKSYVEPPSMNLPEEEFKCKVARDSEDSTRKRIHFAEFGIQLLQENGLQKLQPSCRGSAARAGKRLRHSERKLKFRAQDVERHKRNGLAKIVKRMIFRDMEFLLTGFTSQKKKEIEGVIRNYGGIVLPDVPSLPNSWRKRSSRLKLQQLPIVICSQKLETTKFLYGCAVNAYILNVNWLTDTVSSCSALLPDKYMIIRNHDGEKCTIIGRPLCHSNHNYIFERVGILLLGKHSFSTRLAKVVKVFKSLQRLAQNLDAGKISVGAIIAEDESRASRHLKHCASERKIHLMPASWIINSLHAGKLFPCLENKQYSPLPTIMILDAP